MRNYARIENDLVVELFSTSEDIRNLFHPDMKWVEYTDNVEAGYQYLDETFSKTPEKPTQTNPALSEQLRLMAYADPIFGSDRYFSEVLSLQAEGFSATSSEVKEAKAKGLSRKLEIQSLYPYPDK